MQKHSEIFVEGAAKNGVSKQVATELFDQMVLFAEYCLSADTEVLTAEYGWVPIKTLVAQALEAQVFSLSPQGYIYTQPIWQWHHRGMQEVFEYELDNHTMIRATPDHRFMTADGQMLPIDQIFAEGLILASLGQSVGNQATIARVQSDWNPSNHPRSISFYLG
jgi:DNA polymerase-3 subunit alpha